MRKVVRSNRSSRASRRASTLPKAPSGIRGLDEITAGGLPRGRPTLVCGSAGCGKTLFALEFIIRGALEHGEPGVVITFEERPEDLEANVASLGFDLKGLQAKGKVAIDYVHVDRTEIEETGEYNLDGLFIRIQDAIQRVGAKRIVLDTIEALFGGLDNAAILRSELQRLFRWLKDHGLTAVVTAERGDGTLTRSGLEEYVSDCVILLDHRVTSEISTRRLRVVKYRGSVHGTNEYPFLIDAEGFSVLPITALGLDHAASTERVSTGIVRLDEMMGGKGFYRGSTVLFSGTAGCGKTSFVSAIARAALERGERVLYLAFEESPGQLVRNMKSIGVDFTAAVADGRLTIDAARPHQFGLEAHLVRAHKRVAELRPSLVVVDPISNLLSSGTPAETQSMLTRLIDFLKGQGISACFTSLTSGTENEETEVGVSSLVDTWVVLKNVDSGGERNRVCVIVKSRGMPHSNQAAEYLLTSSGLQILDTYLGPAGVLTGSARLAQEARERDEASARAAELKAKEQLLEQKRRSFEARLAELRATRESELFALQKEIETAASAERLVATDRKRMAKSRRALATNGTSDRKER